MASCCKCISFGRLLAVALVGMFCATLVLAAVFPVVRSAAYFSLWRFSSNTVIGQGHVSSGGARISYTCYGTGPALVLLHGGLSSSLDWLGEIPELARHFQVVAIDLRGHGKSTTDATPLNYRLMARDVRAVLDHMGIERAHIAGWSDGGNVGMLFALDYPARTGRLVTPSSNFHPGGISPQSFDSMSGPDDPVNSLPGRWIHDLRSSGAVTWRQLRQRVTAMWRRYPQLTAVDLGSISAPTLVVVGANDYVVRAHAEQMARSIFDARLLVIPDVGHAVPRDAPRILTTHILDFLHEPRRDQGSIHGIAPPPVFNPAAG